MTGPVPAQHIDIESVNAAAVRHEGAMGRACLVTLLLPLKVGCIPVVRKVFMQLLQRSQAQSLPRMQREAAEMNLTLSRTPKVEKHETVCGYESEEGEVLK